MYLGNLRTIPTFIPNSLSCTYLIFQVCLSERLTEQKYIYSVLHGNLPVIGPWSGST